MADIFPLSLLCEEGVSSATVWEFDQEVHPGYVGLGESTRWSRWKITYIYLNHSKHNSSYFFIADTEYQSETTTSQ